MVLPPSLPLHIPKGAPCRAVGGEGGEAGPTPAPTKLLLRKSPSPPSAMPFCSAHSDGALPKFVPAPTGPSSFPWPGLTPGRLKPSNESDLGNPDACR